MGQGTITTETIEDTTYGVYMLDPLVANDMLVDIIKTIGPSVGAILGSLGEADSKDDALNTKISSESMQAAFVEFSTRVSKIQLRETMNVLARKTEVQVGDTAKMLDSVFADHFRGRIGLMYRWFYFALKVQFADFFLYMGPAIARATQAAGTAGSSSLSTSIEPG